MLEQYFNKAFELYEARFLAGFGISYNPSELIQQRMAVKLAQKLEVFEEPKLDEIREILFHPDDYDTLEVCAAIETGLYIQRLLGASK